MQILIQLPNGKNKRDPLTVDANGYILHNGQKIRDPKNSFAPSKSHMIHLELRKIDSKIVGFLATFSKASKRNQNIVYSLYDQYRTISNLFSALHNEATNKSRFRIPKSFYDEVKKLDTLIESIAKHIKHKPKNKFDTDLLKYFHMVKTMRNSIEEIEKCPVPRCDTQGYCMEPLSTTNRDFKKRRVVKQFIDGYLAKYGKLPKHPIVEKHLQKVLGQKWGVFKTGDKNPLEIYPTKSAAQSHQSQLGKNYSVDIMNTISERTYQEYKIEYRNKTIEWFFSKTDLVLVRNKP